MINEGHSGNAMFDKAEKLYAELSVSMIAFRRRDIGRDERRGNLEIVQCLYLIFHQRLERLDDKACARAEENWPLEAERLPTADWPDGYPVLASKDRQDDRQRTVPQLRLAQNLDDPARVDASRVEV